MTSIAVRIDRTNTQSYVCVCCLCHRVKAPSGEWEPRFLPDDELVSHGICRSCFVRNYPEIPVPSELK
jgi:hypothetical protein